MVAFRKAVLRGSMAIREQLRVAATTRRAKLQTYAPGLAARVGRIAHFPAPLVTLTRVDAGGLFFPGSVPRMVRGAKNRQ
jgi:hypothetical protein